MESNTFADLSSIINSDMITGVFSQITGLIPVVLPATFLLLGLRKGISFVTGMVRKA